VGLTFYNRVIKNVTTVSLIFIIFACFIALVELGRYSEHQLLNTCKRQETLVEKLNTKH